MRPRNNGFVRRERAHRADRARRRPRHDGLLYRRRICPSTTDLAQTFAISDRYFCSVLGPTFPNRAYLVAGNVVRPSDHERDHPASPVAYKPITGTIYDLLNANGVSWTDYYSDLPYSVDLLRRPQSQHQAAWRSSPSTRRGRPAAAGCLRRSLGVDDQIINGNVYQTDEHPPNDIRAGEYFVSTIVDALRNGPHWNDSILIITYDEHGGFYDHVARRRRRREGGHARRHRPGTMRGPSNPPASQQPGGGLNCNVSATQEAPGVCPGFTPTGPYPANCPTFNQLGVRLPFIVVSPFAKPHYVSHAVGDHTSMLALIEKRFLPPDASHGAGSERRYPRRHLRLRQLAVDQRIGADRSAPPAERSRLPVRVSAGRSRLRMRTAPWKGSHGLLSQSRQTPSKDTPIPEETVLTRGRMRNGPALPRDQTLSRTTVVRESRAAHLLTPRQRARWRAGRAGNSPRSPCVIRHLSRTTDRAR